MCGSTACVAMFYAFARILAQLIVKIMDKKKQGSFRTNWGLNKRGKRLFVFDSQYFCGEKGVGKLLNVMLCSMLLLKDQQR